MLPATDEVAPWPWRDHLAALGALRRGVAGQSSVDAADGVKARRILFSLGKPSGDLLAALGALDRFERALVECDETQRLNCLAILDRLTASDRPRGSH